MANGYVNFSDFFDMNADSVAAEAQTQQASAADNEQLQAQLDAQYQADVRDGTQKNYADYSEFLELQSRAKQANAYDDAERRNRSVYDNAYGAAPETSDPLQKQIDQGQQRNVDYKGTFDAYRAARDQRWKDYRANIEKANEARNIEMSKRGYEKNARGQWTEYDSRGNMTGTRQLARDREEKFKKTGGATWGGIASNPYK